MDTASNPSPAPIQAQNSPRSRQSRRSSAAARGITESSNLSLSGVVDQEQFLISSSSTTSSDSFPSKESSTMVAASDDASAFLAGLDAHSHSQLDDTENCGAAKKPAWSKPSNEAAVAEVGAVMGADSWPALSESARASPKSSSAHSLKALYHGTITAPQEIAVGPLSAPKDASISTPNSTPNHVPARQRSLKFGSGGGNSSQISVPTNDNSLSQAPLAQGAIVETSLPNSGKNNGSTGESSRDNTYRDAGQRGGSYGGNELQRGSFRRHNSGRGDGSYHHSHGGRRDHQERGKQDWGNQHRSFGSRESHAPQQRGGSRPFLRGPSPNAPFIPPPPPPTIRPFAPMVYTEMPSPPLFYVPGSPSDPYRPMFPMPPLYYTPMVDPQLHSKILNQIDYYFSNENLVKDTFLRRNMDNEGWVPVTLIAGFKKVMQLTNNIQLILDAVQASNVVEVQGDKVRRRSDWNKWIMPSVQATVTSPQLINMSSQNMLAAHLNSVTLNEKAAI